MGNSNLQTKMENAAEFYADASELRAAIQLIPYIGGPLDTLLSAKGQSIQYQRIMMYIEDLQARMDKIEVLRDVDASEEFYDLSMSIFTAVSKTRSSEKRKWFASILVNKLHKDLEWDEADLMVQLLDSLNDIHIQVLRIAMEAPVCTDVFSGKRVIALREPFDNASSNIHPTVLINIIFNASQTILEMACSGLVAKGLLRDEGVGRLSTKAMEFFVLTEMGERFLYWIAE